MGRRPSKGPPLQGRGATDFRRRQSRLCIAKQISRPPSSSTCVPAPKGGEGASPPTAFAAHEGRAGCRADQLRPGGKKPMTIPTHDDAYEPAHTASQTAHALDELQLYGYRPFDEPDPRPMPDGQRLAVAVADIFDALVATLEDTRMVPDLEEVLWGQVNLFHRATARIERSLDENEQAQRRL